MLEIKILFHIKKYIINLNDDNLMYFELNYLLINSIP